ncbi:MAG: hypothetical protein WBF03_11705 [Xanthobacteraceae bacterium]
MRRLIGFVSRFPGGLLKQSLLATGLGLCMVCGVLADDIAVSEQTFSCILDWPKIRGTYIKNADPQKLQEAMRIFRDNVPDTEYPVGTILQVIPFEAMVKHQHGTFAKTHDWEFFTLDVSAAGTKITDRGENVLEIFDMDAAAAGVAMSDHPRGVTCLSCHQGGAKYDLVCEKGHGCAPIPLNDQQIAKLQAADPRCAKK